ncbi:Hypothetical protein, partial CDS, partial [Neorhizobium galegae bv. orientalis]
MERRRPIINIAQPSNNPTKEP